MVPTLVAEPTKADLAQGRESASIQRLYGFKTRICPSTMEVSNEAESSCGRVVFLHAFVAIRPSQDVSNAVDHESEE